MFNDYQTAIYSQDVVKKSILNSYLWMAIGLLITGIVSYGLYMTGWFLQLCTSVPILCLALPFVQIGLVIAFSTRLRRNTSASTMKVLFILYSLTLGFSMTSLFYGYTEGVIFFAFLVSALYFFCLVFIGFTTKKDMSRIGMICMAGLFAMIISQVIMMFLRVNMDTRLYSLIGLLLFTGITVWDVQRMNKVFTMDDGSIVSREKLSIYFAMELYLDFINIFLYILRLVGMGSSKD
ncbi:Bax inhibitor-1/YccA family protein [uncultured Faecalicoccus sp.]|uniref:Bax inhibitor-1/YccA family protein n=1 Tax=uncultured Faecalicoccus sp. TaxID=1971760 RepID=UPI00260C2682|nr:Bax inhibitor-1/YccA family protein [uncultured Faecalicoccus sp.]